MMKKQIKTKEPQTLASRLKKVIKKRLKQLRKKSRKAPAFLRLFATLFLVVLTTSYAMADVSIMDAVRASGFVYDAGKPPVHSKNYIYDESAPVLSASDFSN